MAAPDMPEMDLTPRTNADGTAVGRKRKRNVIPLVVLALVVVAGGVIVTQFLNSAVDYFCNVDEIDQRDGCEADRRLRLQGTVDEGTIEMVGGRTLFTMSFGDATIPVEYDGEPGGIFQECIPVVVHGEIENDVFMGDRVEVKHSDEYEAENEANLDAAEAEAEEAGCEPVDV
ncbi:cytochrome c maturation protein CcmE domain-containing protein [Ilumatobacter coccineus]|uniref:Cytochrome c-type biogenesis protein CcmE n=1 Tax=Ilumatobacter coccineus (strain NBRC 103263 / KCTC 29153 / YM16-304) TaxID=1313172 RepID=A0A6C7E2H4_ILUCY|nr:cytochrome c maturation protein CcmE [Ilumatobacter coccineus]BAN01277.1 cytochrome c-type biogenesis protein CcmE [Ilumatobacter coccineus YM16-304]